MSVCQSGASRGLWPIACRCSRPLQHANRFRGESFPIEALASASVMATLRLARVRSAAHRSKKKKKTKKKRPKEKSETPFFSSQGAQELFNVRHHNPTLTNKSRSKAGETEAITVLARC